VFQYIGFSVQIVSDIDSLIWGKLVINAAINPLTALLGVQNGELLQSRSARVLLANVALEVASIATVKGIQLPFTDPIASCDRSKLRQTVHRCCKISNVARQRKLMPFVEQS
jgi:ketopantoate reductase